MKCPYKNSTLYFCKIHLAAILNNLQTKLVNMIYENAKEPTPELKVKHKRPNKKKVLIKVDPMRMRSRRSMPLIEEEWSDESD